MAQVRNYTAKGEMFSADDVAELANEFYNDNDKLLGIERSLNMTLHARVCSFTRTSILENVGVCDTEEGGREGSVVLVPYDVAANHLPALLGGKKPHWCVVKGFVIRREENALPHINSQLMKRPALRLQLGEMGEIRAKLTQESATAEGREGCDDSEVHGLTLILKGKEIPDVTLAGVQEGDIHAIVKHGKSAMLSLYPLDALRLSNLNLLHFPDTSSGLRVRGGSDLFGLRNKIVVLKVKMKRI